MADFIFPSQGEHTAILGCTGSGKTQFALWQLSQAPFNVFPYFIIDYKGDDLVNSISRARDLDFSERIPDEPGLYIIHARPDEKDQCEDWLRRLWEHENAGLYVDEGYLLPDKAWLQNLLAQGRSKRISVSITSQRPFFVPRSVFTEASYLSVFRLNDDGDKQRVSEFSPKGMLKDRLPDFHSLWYSVKHHKADDLWPYLLLNPVPGADQIIADIDARLKPRQRLL